MQQKRSGDYGIKGSSFSQLLTDVYNHTYEVLDTLKKSGVTPAWAQIGNEITWGMVWPDGLSENYRAFKDKWENSLGIMYSDQSHEQTKLGYFLNSTVRISKIMDIGIQVEKNTFRNDPQCTKNYDEFIAKFTFGIRW